MTRSRAKRTRSPGTAKRVTGRQRRGATPDTFARLLADKERQAEGHGALHVAMALAATTPKVRVDAAATPFAPTPSELLDCTFDDARVGLERAGMVAFKTNLTALLPSIATEVQAIPEDPSLTIRDVARYIAASLGAEEQAPRKRVRARAGGLLVTSAGPLQQARERVRDRYGSQFASKASDAVLLMMGQSAEREGVVGVRAMRAGVAAPAGEVTLIVELTPRAEPAPPARETATHEAALRKAARLQDAETHDRHVGTAQMLRQTRLPSIRDAFYKTAAPLYAEIGKRANSNARRDAVGSRRLLDMCWLNETIRTAAAAVSLADVAPDPSIEHIDLPRRLEREMRLCGPLIGAPVFRTRTSKDGTGIVIAVIDGEVDVLHPALAGRVMHKRNLTREPFGVPDDHGTAVAGIVGASDRRFGGIAPGASILNYKIFAADPRLDSDDFDGSLALQQALEDGAHVANCSWGAGPAGDGTGREARACDAAWNLGMVVVKSAGNKGPEARTLTTPADADGVIVVGATDRRGRAVENYSSRGPAGARERPHLLAPGGSALSGIETCLPGGRFGNAGVGTSFAAPQISGLAALLLDNDPDLLPDAIRETLIRACRKLADVDVASQGAGLITLS